MNSFDISLNLPASAFNAEFVQQLEDLAKRLTAAVSDRRVSLHVWTSNQGASTQENF